MGRNDNPLDPIHPPLRICPSIPEAADSRRRAHDEPRQPEKDTHVPPHDQDGTLVVGVQWLLKSATISLVLRILISPSWCPHRGEVVERIFPSLHLDM